MLRFTRLVGLGYLALCLTMLLSLLLGGPRFYAPLSSLVAPLPGPVTVVVGYSPEQETWLKEAIARFETRGASIDRRPIKVELHRMASLQMVDHIVGGQFQPTAIIPASSLAASMLDERWGTHHGKPILAGSPQPLAFTPLVLIVWRDIGERHWSSHTVSWDDVYAAATDDGSNYLKLRHARPSISDSGLATLIVLMRNYYADKASNGITAADIQNPKFQQWIETFERAVDFDDNDADLARSMILVGPSQYEAIISYENLLIEYADKSARWGELRVYYPSYDFWSDHPFAILQAPWISAEQQQAAIVLREYLLSEEAQQAALQAGLRPADPAISIDTQDSPFKQYARNGIKLDINRPAAEWPTEAASALRTLWVNTIDR